MSFSGIIGHKNVIDFLEKSMKNGEIAHAYLFYGPNRVGKRTIAGKFAELLLGQPILNHPDVYFVRREKNEKEEKMFSEISIGQMRDLERKLNLTSFLNSYKIAIIEEAETMSLEAANSLLKTLEEPTEKTVIILLSSSISALPGTIVSRCQTLKFLPVGEDLIYQYLIGEGASRGEALDFAKASWGKPGVAIDFWRDREEGEESAVSKYRTEIKAVVDLMRADTLAERMKNFDKILPAEKAADDMVSSLNGVLSVWSSVLRDAAVVKAGCPELINNYFFSEDIKKIAGRFDLLWFAKLHQGVLEAGRHIRNNFNHRLVLENLMLSF